jgi:hypothetical protein
MSTFLFLDDHKYLADLKRRKRFTESQLLREIVRDWVNLRRKGLMPDIRDAEAIQTREPSQIDRNFESETKALAALIDERLNPIRELQVTILERINSRSALPGSNNSPELFELVRSEIDENAMRFQNIFLRQQETLHDRLGIISSTMQSIYCLITHVIHCLWVNLDATVNSSITTRRLLDDELDIDDEQKKFETRNIVLYERARTFLAAIENHLKIPAEARAKGIPHEDITHHIPFTETSDISDGYVAVREDDERSKETGNDSRVNSRTESTRSSG